MSWSELLIPIVFVVLTWWASTGAVLWLARGLDRQMHSRLVLMTIVCALGFAGVIIASASASLWAVYLGFISAIFIWGWVEFTLLAGMITGDRQSPCPENITETKRFALAFRTIHHHEYALVIMLVILAVLDTNGGGGMAVKTFAALWVLRLLAKLTLFSGAPAISTTMMPERLTYMKSYFRHDRVSIAFWISIAICFCFMAAGIHALATVDYTLQAQTQIVVLTTLAGLALLEHAFMVLPVPETRLWQWAMPAATPHPVSFEQKTLHVQRENARQSGQE